jgi:tryptophanyl-tRNA synthetase
MQASRKRILTGTRPTGQLHLGHYVGALKHWVGLQDEYECYFLIADYHGLADHMDDIERIRRSVLEVALDWLAVGLDPQRASFVIQSYVPEHAELTMYLSMLATKGQLDRNPTLKTEMAQISADKKPITVGFYIYPISQVADILLPRAHLVPVGEDQRPHVEFTRDIAQRFNGTYGEVFPVPEGKYGEVGRLVGVDGRAKMSKSLDNAIYLADSSEVVCAKVRRMVTDITGKHPRLRATDPGIVEDNLVFLYHDAFNPDTDEVAELKRRYRAGQVSDGEIKDRLVTVLNSFLAPIRERRAHFAAHLDDVMDVLVTGSRREKALAEATIQTVRDAMRLTYTAAYVNAKG